MAVSGRRNSGLTFAILAQVPERGGETEFGEESLCFIHSFSSPLRIASVRLVPGESKFPALIQRKDPATRAIPVAAPAVYMLFRPEEKHGVSSEDNIVPPSRRRPSEMQNPFSRLKNQVRNSKIHRITAASARGSNTGILLH